MAELTSSAKTLEIEEIIDGEHVETDDYFFRKLGDSIPLTSNDAVFTSEFVPSKPLALSQRFGLIFAAHSSGFCVAKTKDVICAAKEIKAKKSGRTVQELSVVDVDIGRVSILALSEDSTHVSAVVANQIHFFAVVSLLNKDQKSLFSCSVESHVKDLLWLNDSAQSFIVLTDRGEMHFGAINKPLEHRMDEIDAVEKSVDGRCLAIGRKNKISILSLQFKEMLQIFIPLDSFKEDNSAIETVKVDSIRWVRADSIVVGCLQIEGGEEKNYFLQVIMSKDGKFINDSSTVSAMQFIDFFPGIIDDIVPYGCGPHLFMNYLENCELAIVANRKNTDQHIMLFSWSQEDNQVSAVDIERDSWLPRIELQENGDDNLVLGLCVDKMLVCENVEVMIGAEEPRELRPHCLIVCLTLEGKLVMFNVASISGSQQSNQTSSAFSDNAQNTTAVSHLNVGEGPSEKERAEQSGTFLGSDESNTKTINSAADVPAAQDPTKNKNFNLSFSGSQQSNQTSSAFSDNAQNTTAVSHVNVGEDPPSEKERAEQSGIFLGSDESNTKTINSAADVPVAQDPTKNKNFNVTLSFEKKFINEPVAGNDGQMASVDVNSSKVLGNSEHSRQETSTQFSLKDSYAQVGLIEKWNIPSQDKSLEKDLAGTSMGAVAKTGFGVSHNISASAGFTSQLGSGVSNTRSPFFSSSSASTKSSLSGFPSTANNSLKNTGTHSANFGMQSSDVFNSSIGKVANFGQKTTSTRDVSEMGSSIPNFKMQSREAVVSQDSTCRSAPLLKGNHLSVSSVGQLNSEQNSSKQFHNVQNMTKELDKLLECIQELGGIRDMCTSAHRSSLEALEEDMRNLSERSRACQNTLEERLKESELLLDKTVQVSARKTHMAGIVRQTTDGQYWDLWDRQKLSSELYQKQQTVLNLSQDLVNKMIELEKHFNALELKRFGESGGANTVSRDLHHRSATLRSSQSLNAIHNATVSQLAAAEQLSDFLSRQMSVLSVKSPPAKQASVKKQVFETIGLPCPDDNLTSPHVAKIFDSPLNKHSLASCSAATHDFRRSQLSGRSSDPDTSRRRRDSLDRNWAKFEAPKTTVKRMLVPDELQNSNGLFSPMDERLGRPSKTKESIATLSKNISAQDKNGYKGLLEKVNPDTITQSTAFKWAGDISETSLFQPQAEQQKMLPPVQGNMFSAVQNVSASSTPSTSSTFSLSSFRVPDKKMEKSHTDAENLETQVGYMGKPNGALGDQMFFGPERSINQSFQAKPPSSPLKDNRMLIPSTNEIELPKRDDKSSLIEWTSQRDNQFSSTLGPFGASGGSSFPKPTVSSESVLGTGGKVFKDSSKEVSQTLSLASSVSTPAAPASPVSFKIPVNEDSSCGRFNVSFSQQSQESVKTGQKPLAEKFGAKPIMAATSQSSQSSTSSAVDRSKSESLTTTATSTEALKYFGSSAGPSEAATVASNAPAEKQPTAFTLPSPSISKSGASGGPPSGKNNSEATITQEDEMEEEAPEETPAADFSLGSLAGFGLGSAVSATATKPNPFGVSLSSTPQSTPTSSSFTVPQGQLFRPASFSLQSPLSQQSQSPTMGPPSAGFGSATPPQQPPAASGFGQPVQIGFGGQQALGSVLGSFGQSRQIGSALPGSGFGGAPSSGGFPNAAGVGGFSTASPPTGGFAGVAAKSGGFAAISATSGGFAGIGGTIGGFTGAAPPASGFGAAAPSGGGFGAAASSGGGFGAAASSGGGFGAAANSGGFASAASAGGGFGAFNNQGTGGFGAGTTGGRQPPSALFTQMRR
ncbi:hypothetical protein vseg_008572 [Gypsophila vaccaria]